MEKKEGGFILKDLSILEKVLQSCLYDLKFRMKLLKDGENFLEKFALKDKRSAFANIAELIQKVIDENKCTALAS